MRNCSQSLKRQSESFIFDGQNHGLAEDGSGSEMDDLIHSWRRIADPGLRRIALDVIRAMATR